MGDARASELAARKGGGETVLPQQEDHRPIWSSPVTFSSMRLEPDDGGSVRRFSDALCIVRLGRGSVSDELAGEPRRWLMLDRFLVYAPVFAVGHLELELVSVGWVRSARARRVRHGAGVRTVPVRPLQPASSGAMSGARV